MDTEAKLVNKIKHLLKRAKVPRWLHHFGPKTYEFYEHMLALFIKRMCKLSLRRISKLLANARNSIGVILENKTLEDSIESYEYVTKDLSIAS